MPPSNTSFATAVNLGSLPADVTQSDINDGGTNFTVYHKFTAPAGAKVIGAWGFSGNIGSGYRPTLKPYLGPAGAPTQILSIGGQNKPIQFPVTAGNEYFLESVKNLDDAGPNELRIRVEVAPDTFVGRGNILVNDDSPGFPLASLSHEIDNTVITFIKDIAAGEAGDILSNGVSALENFNDDTIKVYDKNFTELASHSHSTGTPRLRKCIDANKIYFGLSRNPCELKTIDSAGALVNVLTMTGVTSLRSIAASNDEQTLYFQREVTGNAIEAWDIPGNALIGDFVAGIANTIIVDILVLSDDSVVALYEIFGAGTVTVRRYNSAGVLQNTYNIGTNSEPAGTFARLAYALDDPDSFWVWFHPSGSSGVSRFLNIRASDGVIITTRNHTEYETGVYVADETATPTSRFGNSFSCPFLIMPASTGAGIFVIVPDKRTDNDGVTDVAIPTPTFKTALMP